MDKTYLQKILWLLILSSALLTGCQPAKNSVEGYAMRITEALIAQDAEATDQVMGQVPTEILDSVLDALPFEVVHQYYESMIQGLNARDARWRFNHKGFTVDYLKQQIALSTLEEANIEVEEKPVTIIDPSDTLKDVLSLYKDQLSIEGIHAIADMYIRRDSLKLQWQYLEGITKISAVELIAYNIVNNQFYDVYYTGSSLSISPREALALDYKDLSLSEYIKKDLLSPLLGLVPQGVNAPITISYQVRPLATDGLPVLEAQLTPDGYQPLSKDDQSAFKDPNFFATDVMGYLAVSWTPTLEAPTEVAKAESLYYTLLQIEPIEQIEQEEQP